MDKIYHRTKIDSSVLVNPIILWKLVSRVTDVIDLKVVTCWIYNLPNAVGLLISSTLSRHYCSNVDLHDNSDSVNITSDGCAHLICVPFIP